MGIMRGKLSPGVPIRAVRSFALATAIVVWCGVARATAIAAPSDATLEKEAETPSDSELMLRALTAEHGESPNAKRIERVSAQVRADSLRKRSTTVTTTVWKDPFAEDPEREVIVRMPAPRKQRGGEVAATRRELARARAETASAQAEAAAAQAEVALAKANSARAEAIAARAQAIAARHEAAAARAQYLNLEKGKRMARTRPPEGAQDMGQFALAVSRNAPPRHRLAAKARPRPGLSKAAPPAEPAPVTGPAVDDRPEPPAAAAEAPAPPPPPPPGSIIVVPITR